MTPERAVWLAIIDEVVSDHLRHGDRQESNTADSIMKSIRARMIDTPLLDHYYYIEELIPAKIAIGGKDFWYRIEAGEDNRPNRFDDESEARRDLKRIRGQGRNVRLVEVTIREVEV